VAATKKKAEAKSWTTFKVERVNNPVLQQIIPAIKMKK
jgi:hypothetical protein